MNSAVMTPIRILALLALVLQTTNLGAATNETGALADRRDETRMQRRGRFGFPERGVYKARITPHWFHNDTRFWYRNDLRGGAKEFILVDAEGGTRQPAFDHQKLAAALSKAAGEEFKADRLPFSEIEYRGEGNSIRFEVAGKTWQCDLRTYECTASETSNSQANTNAAPMESQTQNAREQRARPDAEDQDQNQRRRFGAGEPGHPRRSPMSSGAPS